MDPDAILWEAEEGIPQIHDPFIQRFLAGRDSLIQREELQRHDSKLHDALPPVAVKACNIVSRICAQELARINHSHDIPHPSFMSNQAKERLEKSDLWKIVRHVPKGSLLHGHLPAMVEINFLIDQVLATPGFHISAPSSLISRRDYQDAPFSFQYNTRPSADSKDKPTLWSDNYEPSTLIDLQGAAASFPDGGEIGFRSWLKSRCTLTLEHPQFHSRHSSTAFSDLFNRCLPIINSILHNEPILRACLRRILSQLVADKVRYVEFRIAFDFQYTLERSDKAEQDYLGWFRIFEEEIARFKSSEEGQCFYGARVIWAAMRGLSNKDISLSMKQCILAKQEFPGLICGFDFLGHEGHGRPLNDLLPILFWFRGRCAEEGVDIPFFFHAGQSLSDGDQADNNLFDAVLLGSRRISQALSLYKHPLLIDVVKSKNILIEYSPSSSVCLGLADSFQSHPLPALLSRGVSVALSNDSPGIFGLGTNGLSSEFFQALLAFKNTGLTGLTMVAENSIRWSCYEDQPSKEWISEVQEGIIGEGIKATRLQEFYTDFENFCKWVVREFEGDSGDE